MTIAVAAVDAVVDADALCALRAAAIDARPASESRWQMQRTNMGREK